jgi:integrase
LGKDLQGALSKYASICGERPSGMAELIEEAIPTITKNRSANTVSQYVAIAARLKEVFQEFQPKDVKPSDIAELKKAYSDKPNMGNRILSLIRLIFNYALEHRIVDFNPALGIKPHQENKRTRLITKDEFNTIHKKASPKLKLIMQVQSLTGQRIGDVLKIKREDLLKEGISFVQEKTGRKLVVRWSEELNRAVLSASKVFGEGEYLFNNKLGNQTDYSTLKVMFQTAIKKSGVKDARPNDLRAMALTAAEGQGVDPTALAGHSTSATTKRYLRDRKAKLVDGPKY